MWHPERAHCDLPGGTAVLLIVLGSFWRSGRGSARAVWNIGTSASWNSRKSPSRRCRRWRSIGISSTPQYPARLRRKVRTIAHLHPNRVEFSGVGILRLEGQDVLAVNLSADGLNRVFQAVLLEEGIGGAAGSLREHVGDFRLAHVDRFADGVDEAARANILRFEFPVLFQVFLVFYFFLKRLRFFRFVGVARALRARLQFELGLGGGERL